MVVTMWQRDKQKQSIAFIKTCIAPTTHQILKNLAVCVTEICYAKAYVTEVIFWNKIMTVITSKIMTFSFTVIKKGLYNECYRSCVLSSVSNFVWCTWYFRVFIVYSTASDLDLFLKSQRWHTVGTGTENCVSQNFKGTSLLATHCCPSKVNFSLLKSSILY